MKPCCTPSRATKMASADPTTLARERGIATEAPQVVDIPGGHALLGTDHPIFPIDGEDPLRSKRLNGFRMETTTVTNARFQAFVAETGYVTDAERLGDSLVFQGLLPKGEPPSRAIAATPWWRVIEGANWHNPLGSGSADRLEMDHPVTHVAWNDASAFAHWAGGRLPTEAEWEHAARGGLGDVPFPWGETQPNDTDLFPCNIWQGQFPQQNTAQMATGFTIWSAMSGR